MQIVKQTLIIVLAFWVSVSYAQNTDSNQQNTAKRDYPVLNSIEFSAGYGIPLLNNSLMGSTWDQKMGNGGQFSIEYRKQFTKRSTINNRVVDYPTIWAVGTGLGVSAFSKSADLNLVSEQVNSLQDADGDSYNANLDYSGIKEKVSLLYIDVPLYLEIGRLSKTRIKGWGRLGVKGSFLLNDSFEGQGSYTSQGYYPAWDVTLHDVPELDYYTNRSAYTDPEYKLKPFVLWGTLSAGISIPFSNYKEEIIRNTILKLGVKYDFTITQVSEGSSNLMYPGSLYHINKSNIWGGDGSRIHYFGLEVGLVYAF